MSSASSPVSPDDDQQALCNLKSALEALDAALVSEHPLTGHVLDDVRLLNEILGRSDDIETRLFPSAPTPSALVFHSSLVNAGEIAGKIVPAIENGSLEKVGGLPKEATFRQAARDILEGRAVLLTEGADHALSLAVPSRSQSADPRTERVVRGPRAAFTGDLAENLALLRQAVTSERLRVESIAVGGVAKSHLALVSLEGVTSETVRAEFLSRISRADLPGFQDVTQFAPALADDPLSPFPNVQATERVDTAAMALLAGRHVLLGHGSWNSLIFPTTWADLMNSPEDEYLPRFVATFVRLLRYIGAITALVLEALYIAVTSIHQELLPTPLALGVARSRVGVPLPVFAEVILLALVVEVLREATIRLPSVLSQTIAIVGALVIGNAIVRASLISAPVIVVVAVAALASFMIPSYEAAITIRLLRYPGMLLSGILGLFGLSWYVILIIIHLARLHSFGIAYLSPVAPFRKSFAWRVLRLSEGLSKGGR